jgi:hypothetical protein
MSLEYNNTSSVGACNYKNLGNYSGRNSTMAALPSSMNQNAFVVPGYGGISYETLNHGRTVPSCSGYFNIQSAYGAGAGNCSTEYKKKLCNGG